jgi:hypothetical protein
MKNLIYILFLFISLQFCFAQNNWKTKSDSLALISRTKADIVLSHFDSIYSPKILYSLLDKNYYVIIKKNNNYKEYYISTDSISNIINFKEVIKNHNTKNSKQFISNKKKIKALKRIEEEQKTIKDAFELSKYHTNLITCVPEATYISGVPSYFVIKDENGKRYGEYSLSSITTPSPINPNLWVYLLKSITEQMK